MKSPFAALTMFLLFPAPPVLHSPTGLQDLPTPTAASLPSPQETGDELFATVVVNQKRNDDALETYERTERVETRKTSSDGSPVELHVRRAFPVGTGTYKLTLSTGGQSVSADAYRADLEKLEKFLVAVVQRGPVQQEAYAKLERKRKDRNELLNASRQAFIFTFIAKETRAGRSLLRYSMLPNPGFRPPTRTASVFTKVKGTLWIDEQSKQLARIEGTVTDDISIALFLAKVNKGSYFMEERYEVAPGIWFPSFDQFDFDGRKFLSSFSIHERTLYTDYKRIGPPPEALAAVRGELDKLKPGGKLP